MWRDEFSSGAYMSYCEIPTFVYKNNFLVYQQAYINVALLFSMWSYYEEIIYDLVYKRNIFYA